MTSQRFHHRQYWRHVDLYFRRVRHLLLSGTHGRWTQCQSGRRRTGRWATFKLNLIFLNFDSSFIFGEEQMFSFKAIMIIFSEFCNELFYLYCYLCLNFLIIKMYKKLLPLTNHCWLWFLFPSPRCWSGVRGVPHGRGQSSRLTFLVRPLLLHAHHPRVRQPGTTTQSFKIIN